MSRGIALLLCALVFIAVAGIANGENAGAEAVSAEKRGPINDLVAGLPLLGPILNPLLSGLPVVGGL